MAQLLSAPYNQFFDDDGAPLAGGLVYTYEAGTTTPKDTYTDAGGLTAAANPVVLDSAGRADIWLSGYYKIVVKDSGGTTIRTVDTVGSTGATGDMNTSVYDAANIQEQLVGLTATQTLTNKTLTTPTVTWATGSWTPAITFATAGDLSVAYSQQTGQYYKFGQMVWASFAINTTTFTHTTASGAASITGLPFACSVTTNLIPSCPLAWRGITKASYYDMIAQVGNGGTSMNMILSASGSSPYTVTATDMPTTGVVTLRGTIIYPTSS